MQYIREKNAAYLTALSPAVGPESKSKLVRSLRSIMFPEEKYDDFAYMRKAKDLFEKLRSVNLFVKPVG